MPKSVNPPSFKQLQYFVTIASRASYRRAAEELGVSQPALTTQIRALESTLGLSLFERSRSGTLLTPEGRDLLDQARQLILAMREFSAKAELISQGHQSTYKLGVPPTLGPYLLPNVLPALHAKHHNLKLYVREGPPRLLLQGLADGTYDIAIVPLPVTRDDLAVVPLFTEPLKFVVPADHRLAGKAQVTPSQLRGEKVLTLEDQHHFHHQVQEICERLGAHLQRDYEGTSLDTLRQMVVMGLGVAFLPGLYVHSEMHNPEALHVSELKAKPIRRQHGLVWRASAPARHFYRELAAHLREIIEDRLGDVVTVNR
ncbi:hydrogen peroxide-inducible genes activator [Microbulbifer sp. CAU 1566]|uniref:hydrogen peroxide-inducible genes activator n=1 Tax=unclassified Microbulbifer TaxID=2619833 RepID=UPI001359F67F|nr:MULTISPECIES: hydrogen peroxide-inducible genes activator [unclassified Microbulbifer]MCK7597390.1 hydrogen peroxide-inducible genes activator [Microbulbifer sp. CAU 1566]